MSKYTRHILRILFLVSCLFVSCTTASQAEAMESDGSCCADGCRHLPL